MKRVFFAQMSTCEELLNMYEFAKKIKGWGDKNHEHNLFLFLVGGFFLGGGSSSKIVRPVPQDLQASLLHSKEVVEL